MDRVARWVEEAVASGARIGSGGERLGATTYAPTVLVEHAPSAEISREVAFGPVTCVYAYR